MGRQTLQPLQQLPGMGFPVVDAVDHGILKMNAPGSGCVIAAAGIQQRIDIIGLVHRHDPVTDFIVGAVEGDGQADLQLLRSQFIDLRHQAAGT